MNNYRKTATIVGILYIIGTVAGVLSVIVTGSILDGSDVVAKVAANPNQLTLGGLLVLTMGLALAMVPVLLFPIFRKINEVLAVGYVVFRGALETAAYMPLVGLWLLLVVLGREYACSRRLGRPVFSNPGSAASGRWRCDQYHHDHCLLPGRSDAVHRAISIPTRAALDLHLGFRRDPVESGERLPDDVPSHDGFLHDQYGYEFPHLPSGNGHGGLADRDGI